MRHTAAMAWWTAECIRAFYIGSGAAFLPIQKQWSTSALGVLPPAATGSWVKAWKKDSTRSNHRLAVVDSSQGCVGDGPPGSASKLGADLAMMMKRIVAPSGHQRLEHRVAVALGVDESDIVADAGDRHRLA